MTAELPPDTTPSPGPPRRSVGLRAVPSGWTADPPLRACRVMTATASGTRTGPRHPKVKDTERGPHLGTSVPAEHSCPDCGVSPIPRHFQWAPRAPLACGLKGAQNLHWGRSPAGDGAQRGASRPRPACSRRERGLTARWRALYGDVLPAPRGKCWGQNGTNVLVRGDAPGAD